jgi:hypothetical protein
LARSGRGAHCRRYGRQPGRQRGRPNWVICAAARIANMADRRSHDRPHLPVITLAGRFHRAGQQDVRNVAADTQAIGPDETKRLGGDRGNPGIEVSQHDPGQLQPAFIGHQPVARRRPIPARIMAVAGPSCGPHAPASAYRLPGRRAPPAPPPIAGRSRRSPGQCGPASPALTLTPANQQTLKVNHKLAGDPAQGGQPGLGFRPAVSAAWLATGAGTGRLSGRQPGRTTSRGGSRLTRRTASGRRGRRGRPPSASRRPPRPRTTICAVVPGEPGR